MLQIIGFGQVFRLDRGMAPITEMQVQDLRGNVHSIEVTQKIIEQLVKIWANSGKAAVTPAPELPRQEHVDPVVEDAYEEPEDSGEMIGVEPAITPAPVPSETVVTTSETGYPVRVARPLPRPVFMNQPEDTPAAQPDDDGNQI